MCATKIGFGRFRGSRSLRPEEKCKNLDTKKQSKTSIGRARRAGTQSKSTDTNTLTEWVARNHKTPRRQTEEKNNSFHDADEIWFTVHVMCVCVEVDCWCGYGLPQKHWRFRSNPKRRNCFCIYLFAAVGHLAKVRSKCDGMTTHE